MLPQLLIVDGQFFSDFFYHYYMISLVHKEKGGSNAMNQDLQEKLYKEAVTLCKDSVNHEKVMKARDIFADLGDFEDSADYLKRCDEFLAIKVGSKITMGEYNGKTLTWTVLKTEGARYMLFCDDTVANTCFNERRIGSNWNSSTLRKWLNVTFFNDAFSFQEKMKIQIQRLFNNFDPRWDNQNGPDTKDKLYVFSENELLELLPEPEDRNIGKWWWLRGHGESDLSQKAIYEDGSIYKNGIDESYDNVGVRPVMWVRITV